MNTITHCDRCGLKTAQLAIHGERSSQYICQVCHGIFERDRPAIEPSVEFITQAKLLIPVPELILYPLQEKPA
jgi:hypothetical protein